MTEMQAMTGSASMEVLKPSASASVPQVLITNEFATCDARLERSSPLLETTVAKVECSAKAFFAFVEAEQQNFSPPVRCVVDNCCGVTLFHPHPFGAGLESGSSNPDVPPREPASRCCGVTLFHPHPCGAALESGSSNPDVPPREPASRCCGVTLFLPHPCGAALESGSSNPDVPPREP
ncbi:MAG: hypothetical protein M0P13_12170, partial [Fibrobacteraceae bacterium]|nr:hypothetical protein [Fibrobacteraceae bacterium]